MGNPYPKLASVSPAILWCGFDLNPSGEYHSMLRYRLIIDTLGVHFQLAPNVVKV